MLRVWYKKQFGEYPLFTGGDLNAFFALFLDNVVNLVILAGILISGFGFPKDVIYTKMIPGTALGVMVGDLIYTYMAFKLAKKEKNYNVTAMPLGLDTPSTIGIAVTVLGPAFLLLKSKYGASPTSEQLNAAAMATWYIGMATMIWMSLVKFVTSFFGAAIQRAVPAAGLLGSLAGIGVAWLAANSFIKTMEMPVIGIISLGIILFTLVAGFKLPKKVPGAAMAVVMGVILFYLSSYFDLFHVKAKALDLSVVAINLPTLEMSGFSVMFGDALKYLPMAIPFGFLTILGGINVTETARISGDNYKTRDILLAESFATFIAGAFGGVSQSTPYIGHSAYKKMGARMGYTALTAILIGIGGATGFISIVVDVIPEAAVAPILIFVGFEITQMAYQESPKHHNMAVTFAIIPAIINFAYVKVKLLYEPFIRFIDNFATLYPNVAIKSQPVLEKLVPYPAFHEYPVLQALGQGFILTSMVWGSCVAFLIDKKAYKASITLAIGAFMTYFGIIHSATSEGKMYFPWELNALQQNLVYALTTSYALMAAGLAILNKFSTSGDVEH